MRPVWIKLVIAGFINGLLCLGLWKLSLQFNWGEGHAERPILEYLLLYLTLFAVYAWAVRLVLRSPPDPRLVWIVLGLGLCMRAALIPSQPIQEDDVYRYLWDGKVSGNGINPYKYAPEQVTYFKQFMIRQPERFARTYDADSVRELEQLAALKWENERALVYMERINHPHLPTLYPPLAQAVFRAVYHLAPDSIPAMRLAFGLFDLMTVGFLILLLKRLGMNPAWSLIWFWSPLVLKETYNSTHLDVIGIACLTGSLYFLSSRRFAAACGSLALGVLGKLYPLILFPFYLKEAWRHLRARGNGPAGRVIGCLAVFFGVLALGYLPFVEPGTNPFGSLKTFSTFWQSNDSLFALLVWVFREGMGIEASGPVGWSYDLPSLLAKISAALLFGGVWTAFLLRPTPGPAAGEAPALPLLRRLFILMALVFLLSPVANPWYLCWVLPFLCLFPMRSWLLLTGLVGLYYLEFYFDYQEMPEYKTWIPWLEYLPFYIGLFWETRKKLFAILRPGA